MVFFWRNRPSCRGRAPLRRRAGRVRPVSARWFNFRRHDSRKREQRDAPRKLEHDLHPRHDGRHRRTHGGPCGVCDGPSVTHVSAWATRGVRKSFVIVFLALALSSCRDDDRTSATSSCAAKLHPSLDRGDLAQCMDVCTKCAAGTPITCSTSCNLKGAR